MVDQGTGRLAGKRAVVTGAANGIGQAIATRFLADGARVCLFDIEAGDLEAAASALGQPDRVIMVHGDVSRRDDVRNAVNQCVSAFGGLDIMVSNAGITRSEPFLDVTDEAWQRILAVNLTGAFFCLQEAARVMAAAGGGAIVATASTNAWWVETSMAHYNASKGGLVALVKSAAIDLGHYGIRVNAIAPGMIRTRINHIVNDPVAGPDYLRMVPLGRFAEPAEMAAVAAFLASDDASYVTGELMVADGGTTIGIRLPEPASPVPGMENIDPRPS